MQLNMQRNTTFLITWKLAKATQQRKTWNLINELSSRNTSKSSNILEIQVDNRTISTSGDIAEAFYEHFTNIGQVPVQEVPTAEVNTEFYLSYTDKAFCLKHRYLDVVLNLLRKIDQKKATGLDMIPSKLLKMAASIVAPSLTAICTKSIITGIYSTEWKMARVTPVFKKGCKIGAQQLSSNFRYPGCLEGF